MPRDKFYVPGTFYRICDRSGFKTRSYDTEKEWNGLIVQTRFWEARQPQDLVQGVRDDQVAPDARPRQPDRFVLVTTYLVSATAPGGNVLNVRSAAGFSPGDRILVMLDSGVQFPAFVNSTTGYTITIVPPLPSIAGSDALNQENSVIDLGPQPVSTTTFVLDLPGYDTLDTNTLG